MTIQQLEYVSEVAQLGSINKAAQHLYVSQSSISNSIKALETEFQIQIFSRSSSGINLTDDGREFLAHARSLLSQADHMEKLFKKSSIKHFQRLTVASQHLAFATKAMIELVNSAGDDGCEFALKELFVNDLLDDVVQDKSDLGIIFLSDVMRNLINSLSESRGVEFHEICRIRPRLSVRRDHPLTKLSKVSLSDLEPYPYTAFFQDFSTPFDHVEELRLSAQYTPHKIIYTSDRGTVYDLLRSTDAYHICTGMRSPEEIACTTLLPVVEYTEELRLGWFKLKHKQLSSNAQQYLSILTRLVYQWLSEDGSAG